jgi:hypothetical protein
MMKNLFCNPIYMLCVLTSVLQVNGVANIVIYKPKYLEHHFGISTAKAVFLIGMYFHYLLGSTSPPRRTCFKQYLKDMIKSNIT